MGNFKSCHNTYLEMAGLFDKKIQVVAGVEAANLNILKQLKSLNELVVELSQANLQVFDKMKDPGHVHKTVTTHSVSSHRVEADHAQTVKQILDSEIDISPQPPRSKTNERKLTAVSPLASKTIMLSETINSPSCLSQTFNRLRHAASRNHTTIR